MWILIILGLHNGSAADHIQFFDRPSCEAAKEILIKDDVTNHSWSWYSFNCVAYSIEYK